MNLPLAGSSGETQPSQQNIYMKSVSESQVSAMDSLSEKLGICTDRATSGDGPVN